jgi:hypothetical protein
MFFWLLDLFGEKAWIVVAIVAVCFTVYKLAELFAH